MEALLFTLLSPSIIVLCYVLGLVIKHCIKKIDTKYIPLIVACFGVLLACLMVHSITVDAVAQGIISGWASTGIHQTFKQLGGKKNNE